MKGKVKKSGSIFAALKSGQQILHDLDAIVMDNTVADVARFATEQYVCKIGSTAVAAYAIDKAISYLEELVLPKSIRGIVPLSAATIGAGVAVHYFGQYINMEQGLGVIETTKQILGNYRDNFIKLISLDPTIREGYLIGSLIIAKSGLRWLKNLGEAIAYRADKKRTEKEYQQQLELEKLKK